MNTQYMMWMDYDKWPLYLEAASHHASEPLR